jgi:chromosome partitioning protein
MSSEHLHKPLREDSCLSPLPECRCIKLTRPASAARLFRPQLCAAFVINRRVVGTVFGREARAALADQPFAALHAEVSQRIVFADSVAAGRLAYGVSPECAAARELAALANAVQEALR